MSTATIHRSVLLPYPVAGVFALVADVERYKEFLPGCTWSEIERFAPNRFEARLSISLLGVTEEIVTRNTTRPNSQIDLEFVRGPFNSFHGRWLFHDLREGCRAELEVEFELANRLLRFVQTGFIERGVNKVLDAFASRAHKTLAS